MWQRWLWIGLVCVMVLWLPAPVAAQAPLPLVVISAGERYQGHLATFDQSIVVLGEVDGDVTSWAGSITVHGTVRGDVVSYTGTVELKAGAVVEGNVLSIAGGVVVNPAVQVRGALIGIEPLAGSNLVSALVGVASGQRAIRHWLPPVVSHFVSGLVILFFSVAVAFIWPRRTAGIGRTLRAAPLRSALVGVLSTVLILLMLPFLVGLLTVSLVGLVLFIPLIILLHIPYIIGFTGVARAIAVMWAPGWALRPPLAAAFGACVVLLPLILLSFVAPVLAVLLGYAIASWGLGAAFISRGGALPIWRDGWQLVGRGNRF
jgi:hypothetical protein